jgi:hypothetical protein
MRLALLIHAEYLLARACVAVRSHRIERTFAQAGRNVGTDTSPQSFWDDVTKPTRLELRHLGFPA